ncbi:GNAT family N-acetyltransferase [Jatrophihabitans sp.]|jgi:aminoglycoside 6'-N-acetyltransferase|uniref:GNAT family N-acetyltransferase n=1 Tax=Jatrophihabitans sp. TaxID=1932789 RepID=UPI002F18A8F5
MVATSTPDAPSGHTETAPVLLRPMTADDLPLMSRWLGAAHVHRWWHDSSEPAAVSAEYLPCIQGTEPSHPLIAELPSGPVAFLQWYRWADYPDYGRKVGAHPDEAGFDYLIGEETHCGQGLGTRLIAALIRLIREQDPSVGGFVIDPEQANTASRRVLEKNGLSLVAVKQIDDPDGPPVGPSAIYRRRFTAVRPSGSVGDLGGP